LRGNQLQCAKCPKPGIFPENKTAWALFSRSSSQLLTSFGGVIGLNYLAVQWVADKFEIKLDAEMLVKLQAMESEFCNCVNASDDAD
jgi:hypothetical protein